MIREAKQKKKIKVLCALSGGVDSAVAAALLVKAGYDVTAAFMVNYDDKNQVDSCWLPDYRDAVRVAAMLGISILKFDFTKEYKQQVLDYMFEEYEAGRTPNPDVLCNKFIKFGSWLEKATSLGFDFLATGHYARVKGSREYGVRSSNKKNLLLSTHYSLLTSVDSNKDQTYFLHQLNQKQLSRVLFPIGEYTKPQVRALAKKFKLPVANKEESMGICFIGEVPMTEFLETRIKPKLGKIIFSDGTVVGEHQSLAFYTIGQRHGLSSRAEPRGGVEGSLHSRELGRDDSKPLFVVSKRLKTNELVVGYDTDPLLFSKEISLADVNWIGGQVPKFPLKCEVRLRHRQPLQKCVVNGVGPPASQARALRTGSKEYGAVVSFDKPQRAATPGQFAVFYKNGECLGGGVIQ